MIVIPRLSFDLPDCPKCGKRTFFLFNEDELNYSVGCLNQRCLFHDDSWYSDQDKAYRAFCAKSKEMLNVKNKIMRKEDLV